MHFALAGQAQTQGRSMGNHLQAGLFPIRRPRQRTANSNGACATESMAHAIDDSSRSIVNLNARAQHNTAQILSGAALNYPVADTHAIHPFHKLLKLVMFIRSISSLIRERQSTSPRIRSEGARSRRNRQNRHDPHSEFSKRRYEMHNQHKQRRPKHRRGDRFTDIAGAGLGS